MNLVRAAITGNHPPLGDVARGDCVIAHSFGTVVEPGSVNHAIAQLAVAYAGDTLPIIADEMIEQTMLGWARQPDSVAYGPISDTLGGGVGTWGALKHARAYMNSYDARPLNQPITVAQAFHIGRFAAQSIKLAMQPIIPADLPRHFDAESEQPWTRSRALWIPRELVGMAYLRRKGQL